MSVSRRWSWIIVGSLLSTAAASASGTAATPDDLDAVLKRTPGFKRVKAVSGKLDDADFTSVRMVKGHYYAVLMKLGPGAAWKPGARPSLTVTYQDRPLSVGPDSIGSAGAAFVLPVAPSSKEVTFGPVLFLGPGGAMLGSGAYTLEVYERAGSARERSADADRARRFKLESDRETKTSRQRTCNACAGESPVASERKVCLERRGLSMHDCGW